MAGGDARIQRRHIAQHLETGAHGALRIVLVGLGKAEVDEHAVAHVAGDEALVSLDGKATVVLELADELAQILGVEPGGEGGGAGQVAEHHGELAALGLAVAPLRGCIARRARGRRAGCRLRLGTRRVEDPGRLPGPSAGHPDEGHAVFVGGEPVGDDELVAKVLESLVVELELAFQRAIGDPTPAKQHVDDLIEEHEEVHAHPSRGWGSPSVKLAPPCVAAKPSLQTPRRRRGRYRGPCVNIAARRATSSVDVQSSFAPSWSHAWIIISSAR